VTLDLCFRNAAVCTSCCVMGKETVNGKNCMSMTVLNLQTNKDILVFSIIRQKRNTHDFLIYLTKFVNVYLLLRLKRIALQCN